MNLDQWPTRSCVLRDRLVLHHIYNGPAASRLAGPCNIRVILRYSFKTCGPINTTRDTNFCPPNRRNRAMHHHSPPVVVPSLPDLPLQWFILVFRTCRHHWRSFSQSFRGFSHLDHDAPPWTLHRPSWRITRSSTRFFVIYTFYYALKSCW